MYINYSNKLTQRAYFGTHMLLAKYMTLLYTESDQWSM